MRVKSSGLAPGLANARPPGQHKICKCPTPGTDVAGKCPAVARGGRGWGQLDLLWHPVLRGRGTPDFKLRGCSNADKNQPSPPKKKSIGFLTKPKKSLHKNYPSPLPPKKKHGKRDLVPGHRHRTRILAWVWLKKECSH